MESKREVIREEEEGGFRGALLLTSYLVITGLTTVRPLKAGGRWLDFGAMLVALGVGVTNATFAFEAF